MVVPDASVDVRFHDFPGVWADGGVRFYEGALLVTPDGVRIGTLCLTALEPRGFSAEDRGMLEAFAALVMDEVKLRQVISDLGRVALNDTLMGLPNRMHFRS